MFNEIRNKLCEWIKLRCPCKGAISKTESKLQLIIDTSPIGICTVDSAGNFIDTNLAYEQMLGYSKTELKGMSLFEVTHPSYRAENKTRFQKMFTYEADGFKMEKVYIRKNGLAMDVSVYASAVQGKVLGVRFGTAFVEDITERNRVLDALVVSEAKHKALADIFAASLVKKEQKIV